MRGGRHVRGSLPGRFFLLTIALLLSSPPLLVAELVIENPSRKWRPGETVELLVRGTEVRLGLRIEEVRFDDRPIPFELIDASVDGERRIRIRVPAVRRPGEHRVSVRFSEEPRTPVVEPPVESLVPDLVGRTVDEARSELESRGLRLMTDGVSATTGPRVRGALSSASRPVILRVRRQDPAPGERLAEGSAVAVETEIEVPDLVGLSPEEAASVLEGAGLRWRALFVEPSGGRYRTVVGQRPAPGTGLAPGGELYLAFERLADPPPPVLPWPPMALTAALAATLGVERLRIRRRVRKRFRVEATNDLDGLRASAVAPALGGADLCVRLIAVPDRGRQALRIEGSLLAEGGER